MTASLTRLASSARQAALLTAPGTYTETDRQRDRTLCHAYFGAWKGSFGMTAEQRAARPASRPITFAQFEAAAARLSHPAA